MRMTRSVVTTLAAGLTLTGVAVVAVLAHSPLKVAGTNSIPPSQYIELKENGKLSNCQQSGRIPQGISAIQVGTEGLFFSPAVTVKIFIGSHLLREGHQIAGGVSAPRVTVPVKRLGSTLNNARVCTTIGPALEPIRYYGVPRHLSTKPTNPLQVIMLQMRYLRPGPKPWWSFVSPIAYHMGLGRAPSGSWVVFLVLFLMLVVIIIASRLTLEELR
jgi:hypothetical protein